MARPVSQVNTGVILGAASGILSSFHASMPKPSEVRRTNPTDSDKVADLRHAELHALTAAVVLGGIASLAVNTWTPLYVSLAVSGALIVVNEFSLRT